MENGGCIRELLPTVVQSPLRSWEGRRGERTETVLGVYYYLPQLSSRGRKLELWR